MRNLLFVIGEFLLFSIATKIFGSRSGPPVFDSARSLKQEEMNTSKFTEQKLESDMIQAYSSWYNIVYKEIFFPGVSRVWGFNFF